MTKIARTWRVEAVTVVRLENLVQALGVYPSETVNLLLSASFDQLDAGRWTLLTRPGRPELDGLQEAKVE
jgi:hypothetical protein